MQQIDFNAQLGFQPRATENPAPVAEPNRAQRRAAAKRRRSAAQHRAQKGGKR